MSPLLRIVCVTTICGLSSACTGLIVNPDTEVDGGSETGDGSVIDPPIVPADAGPGDPDARVAPPADAALPPAPFCGDGVCDADEDCASCENDCGVCNSACGDGICNGAGDETCTACAADCNTRDVVCGNGECQAGETSQSCRADCGPATWPAAWAEFEAEVVVLLNQHRAAGTDCPQTTNDPAGPLTMNAALRTATRLHSWDMSHASYFDHTSCNGRSPWERAAAQGTNAFGETIGGYYPSPAAMVNGWMNSQGHCAILMNGGRTEIGVGYANELSGYWTALVR